MKRRKIWFGLGTAVLVASPPAGAMPGFASADAPAQVAQLKGPGGEAGRAHGSHGGERGRAGKAQAGGEGGEGGEGGAAAGRALAAPLRFFRDVALIRGHLLMGDQLVAAGRWEDALPHFLHPQEEIYDEIRHDLKAFGVAPFLPALKSLAQTVKAKNKEAYAKARAAVEERLSVAEAAVRAHQGNRPSFIAEATLEVLQNAAQEYGEAVENGRIANVIEYQDARGFVLEADRLFESVAGELAKKDADAVRTIQASLEELKQAFPTPVPPPAPVRDTGKVLSQVSVVELNVPRLR